MKKKGKKVIDAESQKLELSRQLANAWMDKNRKEREYKELHNIRPDGNGIISITGEQHPDYFIAGEEFYKLQKKIDKKIAKFAKYKHGTELQFVSKDVYGKSIGYVKSVFAAFDGSGLCYKFYAPLVFGNSEWMNPFCHENDIVRRVLKSEKLFDLKKPE